MTSDQEEIEQLHAWIQQMMDLIDNYVPIKDIPDEFDEIRRAMEEWYLQAKGRLVP